MCHKRFVFWKIWSVEELETQFGGTKQMTSRYTAMVCKPEVQKKAKVDGLLKSMKMGHHQSDQHWNCLKGSIWRQQQHQKQTTTTATTTTSLRKEVKRMKNDGLFRAHRYHSRQKRTKLSSELSVWGLAVVRHCGIDHFVEKLFCSRERGHPFDHSYWWSYYFNGGHNYTPRRSATWGTAVITRYTGSTSITKLQCVLFLCCCGSVFIIPIHNVFSHTVE